MLSSIVKALFPRTSSDSDDASSVATGEGIDTQPHSSHKGSDMMDTTNFDDPLHKNDLVQSNAA
jgi:hypothetical protein